VRAQQEITVDEHLECQAQNIIQGSNKYTFEPSTASPLKGLMSLMERFLSEELKVLRCLIRSDSYNYC
jgi:hypothetical protein